MSEPSYPIVHLRREFDDIARTMFAAIHTYGLTSLSEHITPALWQADHASIKAVNSAEWESAIDYLRYQTVDARKSVMDDRGRRIALLTLEKPLDLQRFGTTRYLKVIEPRPDTASWNGYDHIAFAAHDIDAIEKIVREAVDRDPSVKYKRKSNLGHEMIDVRLPSRPGSTIVREIKFSTRTAALDL